MISKLLSKTLYEQDYPQWLEITLQQLQEKDWENLDWENLIEEISSLGNEQKPKLESYLLQLLKHLLLYGHWSPYTIDQILDVEYLPPVTYLWITNLK